MKKIFLLMTLVICALSLSAQSTRVITGAVIDKNGNPLPNALVEATGGAESVSTDADGTFRIEVPFWLKSLTAKYAGFSEKKIKLKQQNQIIFEMKPANQGTWFLNAASSISDYDTFSLGLMSGYLGNWGGYAKLVVPFHEEFTPSFTFGVIKHLYKSFHMYLGAGYTPVYGEDYYNYNYNYDYYLDYEDGAIFELGAIFRFNKVNFSLGIAYSDSFCCNQNLYFQLSVGYCFR